MDAGIDRHLSYGQGWVARDGTREMVGFASCHVVLSCAKRESVACALCWVHVHCYDDAFNERLRDKPADARSTVRDIL